MFARAHFLKQTQVYLGKFVNQYNNDYQRKTNMSTAQLKLLTEQFVMWGSTYEKSVFGRYQVWKERTSSTDWVWNNFVRMVWSEVVSAWDPYLKLYQNLKEAFFNNSLQMLTDKLPEMVRGTSEVTANRRVSLLHCQSSWTGLFLKFKTHSHVFR